MFDMEKLYQRLQKNSQYAVTYQNGQITVTLSRGEVRIREKWAQMLIQGRVYEECEWDELDSADDLAAIVTSLTLFWSAWAATIMRLIRPPTEQRHAGVAGFHFLCLQWPWATWQ